MGYRSDVIYAAEFADKQKRDAALAMAKCKYDLPEDDWECFEKYLDTGLVFTAYDWKWYVDDYPDVRNIRDMFTLFFVEDLKANVRFVRIGEDMTDSEEELYNGSGVDPAEWLWDIHITRTISTPWGVVGAWVE